MTRLGITAHDPRAIGGLALALALTGCYTAQLDPSRTGVFACDAAQDSPCPVGQTCVNERCEDSDALPEITVLNPEDEEALLRGDLVERPDPMPGTPLPMPVTLSINIRGSLELVGADSGADHVFGEGHLAISVDGNEPLVLDSGSISGSTAVMIEVVPTLGPHRIAVQMRRNDGIDYDHPESRATRLFWFESNAMPGEVPFAAIKSPWPGDTFSTDDTDIDIEVAVHNFTLEEASSGRANRVGHAHLYYDKPMPTCILDLDNCDDFYLSVVGASGVASFPLPATDEGTATISAVLRHRNHDSYGFPFDCPVVGAQGPCAPIIDTIEVVRLGD